MKKQSQFKANFRKGKMDINIYLTKEYENKWLRRVRKNKPKQTQSQNRSQKTEIRSQNLLLCPHVLCSRYDLIDPMLPLYPVRKPALRAETVSFTHLTKQPGSNMSDEFSNGVYKPGNDQYYIRHICRCSSMVERSFRKAEVVGPTPTIGCEVVCDCIGKGSRS